MVKKVIWSSMVDYPDRLCSVLFLGGCNFKCPYCFNGALDSEASIGFDEILSKLLVRKPFIDHVLLSGGECSLSKDFESIISSLYDHGFTIGIHTNGSFPDILEAVLPKLDFIGLDIKNDLEHYTEAAGVEVDIEPIRRTIDLILSSEVKYEFRTTVFPPAIGMRNIVSVARFLSSVRANGYVLQQYYSVGNNGIKPYSDETLQEMAAACSHFLPTTVRGLGV